MKRVCLVVGTRPEVLKTAPVYRALVDLDHPPLVLGIQQHTSLLEQHLDETGILLTRYEPVPRDGPGNLSQLLSSATDAADRGLRRLDLDHGVGCVLVQGDTATALAGALAAFHLGMPVGHVEAGLRSWNLASPHPEEAYRRAIDQFATHLYAPTSFALSNLHDRMGWDDSGWKVFCPGNTAVDQLVHVLAHGGTPFYPFDFMDGRPLVVVTMHRREGLDRIPAVCDVLAALAEDHCVVWPRHPNPLVQRKIRACGAHMLEACTHRQFLHMLAGAAAVVTDSGGVVEEAATLGIPTLILRDATERQEAVDAGIAQLVPEAALPSLAARVRDAVGIPRHPTSVQVQGVSINPLFGDGRAGERIAKLAIELAGLR